MNTQVDQKDSTNTLTLSRTKTISSVLPETWDTQKSAYDSAKKKTH